MEKITEASSVYEQLDQMSTLELLNGINEQDQHVAHAVALVIRHQWTPRHCRR
jgi:N-acetylmuramic acid 6-phosphate (MurNAc-6-P) etherase